ncbi:restriction endonuclease subunit S [Muriicola jejuensis]|uniref:Restriction endonuclease subunit S n=1 Tax=Muriicola jejuensis TaxID=504488 RepID=A0A6P0U9T3_9FLAO|nr:restriction endonuclease subunit S [Muriicola jejuensis]NER09985.1 restriction endonuclease subunit S [Muriicola jejuensis]
MQSVKVNPALRFPEFNSSWNEVKLKDVSTKIGSGKTPLGGETVYTDAGIPFIRSQNVVDGSLKLDGTYITHEVHQEMKSSKVYSKDVLLNITGASIGRSCVVPEEFEEGNVNQHVCIIRLKSYESKFIQSFLSSWRGQKLIYQGQTGSGREGINFDSIGRFKIKVPEIEEQQKIASFLSAVDKKIQLLEQKKAFLEEYKKGVMQKLFSREIRFKPEGGGEFPEWEEIRLGQVLSEVKRKSKTNNQHRVISSTTTGLYYQDEYFTRDISSSDNTGYKILEKNQLVFSPQNIWMGNINVNTQFDIGIVSPSYKIYDFKKGYNPLYFNDFLKTPIMQHEYMISSEQGASVVRRNLNIDLFNSIRIKVPSETEQNIIANFLSTLDKKIEFQISQIERTKQFKKGLLQQMFV